MDLDRIEWCTGYPDVPVETMNFMECPLPSLRSIDASLLSTNRHLQTVLFCGILPAETQVSIWPESYSDLRPVSKTGITDSSQTLANLSEERRLTRWPTKTSRFNARIVEAPSPSLLPSRSSTRQRGIPTTRSAAPPAVNPGRQSAMDLIPAGQSGRCSLRSVPSVARKPRCLSSPDQTGLYTAASAITRSARPTGRRLPSIVDPRLLPCSSRSATWQLD